MDNTFTEEQRQIVYPQYAQLICESDHWLSIAQSLYASAERIEPEIKRLWKDMWDSMFADGHKSQPEAFQPADYQRVYLMLLAFTLENLFKGFLVKTRRPEFYNQALHDGELPSLLKTHRLDELAQLCSLKLTEDEQRIVRRLSGHALWIGRYPYPSRAEQFYVFTPPSLIPGNGVAWSSDDVETIKAFIEKAATRLKMALRPNGGGTLA
jgi:hypothetical protein